MSTPAKMSKDQIRQILSAHFDVVFVDDYTTYAFREHGADWNAMYESEPMLLEDAQLYQKALELEEQTKSQVWRAAPSSDGATGEV